MTTVYPISRIYFRQSVIIKRSAYETRQEQQEQEVISISLNIKQLEDRFLQEEENYVLNLHEKFQNAWNEISLGETIISQTAAFFNTGSNSMPPQVFQIVHMQIRYVNPMQQYKISGQLNNLKSLSTRASFKMLKL